MIATSWASRCAPWTALALLGAVAGSGRVDAAPEASATPLRHYTMRAEVVRLPEKPGGYLTLRHEAIDDFTDENGAVVGMDSMVMPFPVAQDGLLDGLGVGDKIEAILKIDWDQGWMQLQRIKKLPPGTALHFWEGTEGREEPAALRIVNTAPRRAGSEKIRTHCPRRCPA